MAKLFISLYSWSVGAFIMIGIFSFVIFSLVASIFTLTGLFVLSVTRLLRAF
ncbi:MAG: hypothetical protein E2604_03100, partial [Flavobacterium sp.]|nr:hypothetical protein [Flavobacterium sp.]